LSGAFGVGTMTHGNLLGPRWVRAQPSLSRSQLCRARRRRVTPLRRAAQSVRDLSEARTRVGPRRRARAVVCHGSCRALGVSAVPVPAVCQRPSPARFQVASSRLQRKQHATRRRAARQFDRGRAAAHLRQPSSSWTPLAPVSSIHAQLAKRASMDKEETVGAQAKPSTCEWRQALTYTDPSGFSGGPYEYHPGSGEGSTSPPGGSSVTPSPSAPPAPSPSPAPAPANDWNPAEMGFTPVDQGARDYTPVDQASPPAPPPGLEQTQPGGDPGGRYAPGGQGAGSPAAPWGIGTGFYTQGPPTMCMTPDASTPSHPLVDRVCDHRDDELQCCWEHRIGPRLLARRRFEPAFAPQIVRQSGAMRFGHDG
jgi:hypothetical protein